MGETLAGKKPRNYAVVSGGFLPHWLCVGGTWEVSGFGLLAESFILRVRC